MASPAFAANEYELNDARETATGPVKGGTDYTATFETENDVDWYVFYVKTYSQMDISATSIGSSCASQWGTIALLDKDGKTIEYFDAGALNVTEHLRLTMTAGRYYLEVYDYAGYCTGDQYRFRIDPAASITTSRECGEAIVSKDAIGPELAKVNEGLTKNAETLALRTAAVRKAKKVVRKLSHRPRVSRYTKRQARRRLESAKSARTKVWLEKTGLDGLAAQQQQAIAAADGQIATYC